MQSSRQKGGKLGEEVAAKLLVKKGYKIISRNFRSRFGEIDIVALDPSTSSGPGGTLVFVEVKTRWSKSYGWPEEAVSFWKIRSIVKTGQYYKLTHPKTPEAMRVDVVAIEVEGSRVGSLKHIENVTS